VHEKTVYLDGKMSKAGGHHHAWKLSRDVRQRVHRPHPYPPRATFASRVPTIAWHHRRSPRDTSTARHPPTAVTGCLRA